MIKYVFAILLVILSYSFSNENFSKSVKVYDKFFKKIAHKRVGVEESKIDSLANPFIVKEKKENNIENNSTKVTKEKEYVLKAIVNKKVKINNKWLSLDESIDEFKIIDIKDRSVVISNGYNKKEIFIREKDAKKIKFFTK